MFLKKQTSFCSLFEVYGLNIVYRSFQIVYTKTVKGSHLVCSTLATFSDIQLGRSFFDVGSTFTIMAIRSQCNLSRMSMCIVLPEDRYRFVFCMIPAPDVIDSCIFHGSMPTPYVPLKDVVSSCNCLFVMIATHTNQDDG